VWDLIGFARVLYNIFAKKSRTIFEERRGHGAWRREHGARRVGAKEGEWVLSR